jgi:(p)ppGpp synthase/HD superfamily hydrolase
MKAKDKSTNKNATGQLHLTSSFTSAIDYARILHIERRKGTDIPYMAHLLGVASLVMGEVGHAGFPITEDMVIAALLHDAAEDQGGELRLQDIECNFGSNVARMVEGLSDSLTADPSHKEPWPERKKAYIRRLHKESADVRLISAADKLYNARTILEDYREIGPQVWDRFKRGREDQIWYFNEILKVYKLHGTGRLVEELQRVVAELRHLSADERIDIPSVEISGTVMPTERRSNERDNPCHQHSPAVRRADTPGEEAEGVPITADAPPG